MPTEPKRALTIQLLEWLSSRPWSEAETLEIWRTHCPRLSMRADEGVDGLVERAPRGDRVDVTELGRLLQHALTGPPS